MLRRLAALPDWPDPAVSGQDLSGWAAWLLKGLQGAAPELKALVELRPEASSDVKSAIGEARDRYDQAVDLLGGLFGKEFSVTAWEDDRRHGIVATLQKAIGHVRACRDALRSVDKSG